MKPGSDERFQPSSSPLTFKFPPCYKEPFILVGHENRATKNTRNESANPHRPPADSGILLCAIEQSRSWIRRKAILESAEVIYAAGTTDKSAPFYIYSQAVQTKPEQGNIGAFFFVPE